MVTLPAIKRQRERALVVVTCWRLRLWCVSVQPRRDSSQPASPTLKSSQQFILLLFFSTFFSVWFCFRILGVDIACFCFACGLYGSHWQRCWLCVDDEEGRPGRHMSLTSVNSCVPLLAFSGAFFYFVEWRVRPFHSAVLSLACRWRWWGWGFSCAVFWLSRENGDRERRDTSKEDITREATH